MYAVVFHHMDDAGLIDEAGFLFFWTSVIFFLFSCPLFLLSSIQAWLKYER